MAYRIFPLMVHLHSIIAWNNGKINEPFITPYEISDLEDVFTNGDMEYTFANYPVDHFQASVLCNGSYDGRLAVIKTVKLAKFLAEALSETNLFMDVLWVGAKSINKTWYWYEEHQRYQPFSRGIIGLFVNYSQSVKSNERNCLAMGRKDHDVPHFPALKCTVKRAIMCERKARGHNNNGSTHPGWIRIGPRLYKIFEETVPWVHAVAKCIAYDREARFAVVKSFSDAQALGRYLLVGRPSLENAWVGAKYYGDHYAFPQEDIILANKSNEDGYPPWRNGTMKKKGGCILLDRHLSNITFFIEARCDRLRPYICYKMDKSAQDYFSDILIDEFGYRIYYNKLPWESARDKCNVYKEKYQAKLAEIRERRIVTHLIYVMGENKTATQHIWLGGLFDPRLEKWVWDSDNSLVQIKGVLDWLKNTTYFENVERVNTCLNMDRENHLKAIHYGTVCDFAQNFVCTFPREKLIQLERDEAGNVTRHVFKRVVRNNRNNQRGTNMTHNSK